MRVFPFSQLNSCDLIIDAIYEGGNNGNSSDDPINKILPVGNQGGFRYKGKVSNPRCIVLYTSGEDKDWPDLIDHETGIFRYYGDNKKPGHELHDTPRKGNLILSNIFQSLHAAENLRQRIPPIFIFRKFRTSNSSRSVQFKGLCVPGTPSLDELDDLVAVWKTSQGLRFQNYSAYFTILDIPKISREWISQILEDNPSLDYMPPAFRIWKEKNIYKPLIAPRSLEFRAIDEQLPPTKGGQEMLNLIHQFFEGNPYKFEHLASEVYRMSNPNVIIDEITQGAIDGGRDAIGRHKLGLDSDPIFVDFVLEAKCYNPGIKGGKINTVGVRETARLISRIRNRQYGVLVTTSSVSKQAYEELRSDQHPIIIISGSDIIRILMDRGINDIPKLETFLNNL